MDWPILPPPSAATDDWGRFMRAVRPGMGMALLADRVRLREIHAHGWTIAVPAKSLKFYSSRKDQLEAALTRVYGGSPKVIHVVELGK